MIKYRAIADPHYLSYSVREHRVSDIGLGYVHKALSDLPKDVDFTLCLGDMLQVDNALGNIDEVHYDDGTGSYHWDAHHLKKIANVFQGATAPSHIILGNNDTDRTGGIKGAAQIIGIPDHSYSKEINGHKLVVLQQAFKDHPCERELHPHSIENLELLADSLSDAKKHGLQSVQIATHAPVDDFKRQRERVKNLNYDLRNTYREGSDKVRELCHTIAAGLPVVITAGHSHLEDIHSQDDNGPSNIIYATLACMVERVNRDLSNPPSGRYADLCTDDNGNTLIETYGHGASDFLFTFDQQTGTFKQAHIRPQPQRWKHLCSELRPGLED